jgi:hypothetical protein
MPTSPPKSTGEGDSGYRIINKECREKGKSGEV